MPNNPENSRQSLGPARPLPGALALVLLCSSVALLGCGENERTRTMPPQQLAMTPDLAPIYDDGEMQLYEVKSGIQFPIVAPSESQQEGLWLEQIEPYGRIPWVTS